MGLFPFVTEHLATKEETTALTQPIWRDLVKVWELSWRRWHRLREDDRRRLGDTPTVRPVMLNGWVQSFAVERFSGRENEGIVVCDAIPHVFAFYIKDELLIRFNGLNNGYLVHCNANASQLRRDYFAQQPIRYLNNSATRLTVGYTLNAAKTDMHSVEISLQVGNDLVYHIPIEGTRKALVPIPSAVGQSAPNQPSISMRKKNPR